jgi:hypothetical protein
MTFQVVKVYDTDKKFHFVAYRKRFIFWRSFSTDLFLPKCYPTLEQAMKVIKEDIAWRTRPTNKIVYLEKIEIKRGA